jgi:hypothetical protein
MNGMIMNWTLTNGTTVSTFGSIEANAAIINESGTIQEWATASGLWSDIQRAYPVGEYPLGDCNITDTGDAVDTQGNKWTGNYTLTYSFYTLRLINFTDISFNKTETGHDFYLAGNWTVSQITETINVTLITSQGDSWSQYQRTVTVTCTATPLATNATGTLVADWGIVIIPFGSGTDMPGPGPIGVGTFDLNITGVGDLSGFAQRSFIWARELNPCDFDGQGFVDISDLVKVAEHYGEAPGFQDYDPSLDVCGEGQIGIGDLATVAANIRG